MTSLGRRGEQKKLVARSGHGPGDDGACTGSGERRAEREAEVSASGGAEVLSQEACAVGGSADPEPMKVAIESSNSVHHGVWCTGDFVPVHGEVKLLSR